MVYFIIYLIIGICLSHYWWNKEYKKEYDYVKSVGEAEDGYAILYLLVVTLLWPIKLFIRIF